jgi:hypothetical protein
MTNYMRRVAITKANRLARELKETRRTDGKTASEFWCILSGTYWMDVPTARKLYLKAGYVPFAGWPLTRKG